MITRHRDVRLRPGIVEGVEPFRFGSAKTVRKPHRHYATIGYRAVGSNIIAWRRLKRQFRRRSDAEAYGPRVYMRLRRMWEVAHLKPIVKPKLWVRFVLWIWQRIAWLNRRFRWPIFGKGERVCQELMRRMVPKLGG